MRCCKPLCALALASLLPACAPFSMENGNLGIEAQTDHQIQSYYLPKTILTATVTVNSTTKAVNLTASKETVVDRQRHFKVHYVNSIVHHDDLYITTTTDGFLSAVKSHSTDKTAQIVEAAKRIFMSTITGQQVDLTDLRALPSGALGEAHVVAVQFDPFNAEDFGGQNAILQPHGFCFAVFDRKDRPLPGSCTGKGALSAGEGGRDWDVTTSYSGTGFFYRRPAEHRVVIFRRSGKVWRPIWAGWHPFEQQGDLHEVRVDRGSFIKLEADLAFTNGNLTKFTMKKPSELLGFMAIPATIVNAVIALPGAQANAAADANTLKERELTVRESEVKSRERELKLVPAGVTSDGRQIYVPTGGTPRSTQGNVGVRQLAEDKQRFMELCAGQPVLNTQDCEAAWSRRNM
jgi:hypothetical protein